MEEYSEKKIKELENKNNFELAKEYKISYEIIINIFDEISNIFNNEEFTLDNFYKIFKIFFPIRRGNNIFFNNTLNFKTISQLQSLFLF